MFYKELHQQNRPITRPNSIKESYPEFAEAMISKLKSYLNQCLIYQNQCLKEFRECITKYEIICSNLPDLVISDIYQKLTISMNSEIDSRKAKSVELFKKLEEEKVSLVLNYFEFFQLKIIP